MARNTLARRLARRLAAWLRGHDLDEPGWRRVVRFVAAAILAATILGLVSKVAGPQWHPAPYTAHIQVATDFTGIVAPQSSMPVGTYAVHETIVEVALTDTVTVQARIVQPRDAPPGQPAVLLLHGAGTGQFTRAFVTQAYDLASAGIVTMVANKRLDTYTATYRDYPNMATDYMQSFDILRNWPGVDPQRTGLYCESEGCYVAPVMAARSENVNFVAMVSAPVVAPRIQAAYAVDNYLHNTRVPGELFRAIPRLLGLEFPALGFRYLDFNVRSYQQQVSKPLFVAYGTKDMSMPIVQGTHMILADATTAGSPGVTVRYYAADHGIRVAGEVEPAFIGDLARWMQVVSATPAPGPQIAGQTPTQKIEADPVASPRWYMNGWMVLAWGALGVALLVFAVVFGLVRWVTRRPRRPMATALRLPLFWFATLTVAAAAALVLYFQSVAYLAFNYRQDDLVVAGGWVLVRTIAILAVLVGLVVFERSYRVVALEGWSWPAWITFTATAAGGTILILLLGYWGVFPFSW